MCGQVSDLICFYIFLQACVCVCGASSVQTHRGDGGSWSVCDWHPASDRQGLGTGHPKCHWWARQGELTGGLTALALLFPEDFNLHYFHPPASTLWIYCTTFSRSPSCRWQRRFALVLWTSATRVCFLRPPARPRGRWAPSSRTSRPPTEPPSTQRASRRPSSCSETPAASPNRAPVRKYHSGISRWHRMFGMLVELVVLHHSATDMVIIYLSSGITSRESSEQEKRATLSVVREENRHLNNSVMILTYALMNGRSPVLETQPEENNW